jgi:hypothetical protein
MALTETKVIDQITVTENGTLLVREATRVLRDDVQIAHTFHRWSFVPGADLSEMPQNVKDIANVTWTPEVITAYQAQMANTTPLQA